MPRRDRSQEIERALLSAVERHPDDLVAFVAAQLGLSRQAVGQRARHLTTAGFLTRHGTTRPSYEPGPNRRVDVSLPLAGLAEDQVWRAHCVTLLNGLPDNVVDIAHYGVTEMVNNAIDHSGGNVLALRIERTGSELGFMVADDGEGIFRKITRELNLADPRLALLELAKGKLTTDPTRHSGEGVFFTSRMFDRFRIFSGGLIFDHDVSHADDMLFESENQPANGTLIHMQIDIHSERTMSSVFAAFSSGPDEYAFARTVVPVRLARLAGGDRLISRSQAKRVLQRVERFRSVVFDFEGVDIIGQAFADEIFRVFALAHPGIELLAIHATPEVQQMIRRAEVLRDETH